MTLDDLNSRQVGAINKIRRLHGSHSIPDGDRFHVDTIADIGRGAVMVFGHEGKHPESTWFDNRYTFTIGPRGAITMVDGPKSMAGFQGRDWCGIHIRLR
jgi:hypothetical protein